MNNIHQDINLASIETHIHRGLSLVLINPTNEGKTPPPLYISQDRENPEHLNQLRVRVINTNVEGLVFDKAPPSNDITSLVFGSFGVLPGIFQSSVKKESWSFGLDFSDFIEPQYLEFLKISVINQLGFEVVKIDPSEDYPRMIWAIQYTDTKSDFELSKDQYLDILVENLVVFQRPSLRYFDFHYRDAVSKQPISLLQSTVLLKRPANYVRSPFPLTTYWMDDHNIIYLSSEEIYLSSEKVEGEPLDGEEKTIKIPALEIENELRFAISNIGLDPLRLDCRQDVRESPYFELIILGKGKKDREGPGFLTRKENIQPIQLEIDEDQYGNKWTHHKMIQGPVVTWRIEPKMFVNGIRNTTIMDIKERGSISFKLSQLRTYGEEGISMIYLKYYNIPDHDDNQLVLFIQKKKVGGSIPSAGIQTKYLDMDQTQGVKEYITAPIRWEVNPKEVEIKNKKEEGKTDKIIMTETTLLLGDKVGIGTNDPLSTLHVDGAMSISNLGTVDQNNNRTATNNAELKLIGTKENSKELREVQIEAAADMGDAGSKMIFRTRPENGGDTVERMVIDSKGNVGIGTIKPFERLEVEGDISIRSSNSTWGSFKFGTNNSKYKESWAGLRSYNTGGLDQSDLRFYTSYGSRKERMRINQHGNVGIGTTDPNAKLEVADTLKITELDKDGKKKKSIELNAKNNKLKFSTGSENCHLMFDKNGLKIESEQSIVLQAHEVSSGGHEDSSKSNITLKAQKLILDSKEIHIGEHVVFAEPFNRSTAVILPFKEKYVDLGADDRRFKNIYCEKIFFKSFGGPSDRSLKKNINQLKNTIVTKDIVQQLEPVSYYWKKDNTHSLQYGFIANDVQKILPDAVSKMKESGLLCLDYQALNTILFQAVKDQQKAIDQLEQEVTDLKQAFAEMQKEIAAMKAVRSF